MNATLAQQADQRLMKKNRWLLNLVIVQSILLVAAVLREIACYFSINATIFFTPNYAVVIIAILLLGFLITTFSPLSTVFARGGYKLCKFFKQAIAGCIASINVFWYTLAFLFAYGWFNPAIEIENLFELSTIDFGDSLITFFSNNKTIL